jgi:hypothetical protein
MDQRHSVFYLARTEHVRHQLFVVRSVRVNSATDLNDGVDVTTIDIKTLRLIL